MQFKKKKNISRKSSPHPPPPSYNIDLFASLRRLSNTYINIWYGIQFMLHAKLTSHPQYIDE